MPHRLTGAISRRKLVGSAGLGSMLAALPASAFGALAEDRREDRRGGFPLIAGGVPAAVAIDAGADTAVRFAARNFASDLERVSGAPARLLEGGPEGARGPVAMIGVLGHSPTIDRLVALGKVAAEDLHGEWEAFRQVVVDDPWPGVPRALIIVGSDRRGAVFGTYDLSERIGVSPWHWFADVPVARKREVLIPAGSRRDQPKVRYRGFFINDEDPCLAAGPRQCSAA